MNKDIIDFIKSNASDDCVLLEDDCYFVVIINKAKKQIDFKQLELDFKGDENG
jgi:hypothetical protein